MTRTPKPAATLLKDCPYIVLQRGRETLQFSLEKEVHHLGRDPDWSDFVVPDTGWDALSKRHAILRRQGQDYQIYDGDGAGQVSTNGLLINRRRIKAEGYLLTRSVRLEIGQDPRNQILLHYVNPATASQSGILHQHPRLDLQSCRNFPVILGRTEEERYESLQLDAPTVSRRHAEINQTAQGNYILSNLSTNGTFVNHQRIDQPVQLKDSDVIRIGPFTLILRESVLELFDRGKQIRLDAHKLLRRVKGKAGETIILNNISLAIEPGQFVALVGGSGAGKSTLMKTLLGIAPTTSGSVYLNGDNLRQHFNIYRSQIGYVPQDDIMHRELTIAEVLQYACQLRLPPDTPSAPIIHKTLEQVKLHHVKDTVISQLSGGQRKRVSIAIELLADPWLFFLDEPTSGLDPGLDKEMMHLLRELADQGRTVILVTHATANIEVCDRVAFLGRGGRLCYFGPPQEAMRFFDMPSADLKYFANIYIELDQGKTKEDVHRHLYNWAQKFEQSLFYQTYVQSVLSKGNTPDTQASALPITAPERNKTSPLRQLSLLSQRYARLIWRDRLNLILSLVTAPIGIALIVLSLGDQNPLAHSASPTMAQAPLALRVLFVFTCAALWVGLSSTAQEFVKEASIYARERLVNLQLLPYVASKVLIHSGLAILQTLLIVAVVLIGFQAPESSLLPWVLGLAVTAFLTLLASFSFGLMISAFAHNESQASSTLPLVLLPQIIFSGVLFELNGLNQLLSWLTISRWSVGAYGALVNVNAMVPSAMPAPMGDSVAAMFEATPVYDPTWQNLGLNWLVLCLHTVVYLLISLWQQKRKDV